MGDANVRRPVATRFEHGVDFGLLVHKSPFMADNRDPLVLSNYIFELLEVNPGVAGFLIQLHPDDVDAVVESVTAHAEKGAGTKTTLYVGQEEEEVEEVEEEEEDAGGVGAGGRKEKPHNPLMISVQKVRIRPLMKLKWPQIFGVSLSLELGKAVTDLKPCTQCGHWPMLGMSIPCASKYRFRPESGPHQQNIARKKIDTQNDPTHNLPSTRRAARTPPPCSVHRQLVLLGLARRGSTGSPDCTRCQ